MGIFRGRDQRFQKLVKFPGIDVPILHHVQGRDVKLLESGQRGIHGVSVKGDDFFSEVPQSLAQHNGHHRLADATLALENKVYRSHIMPLPAT